MAEEVGSVAGEPAGAVEESSGAVVEESGEPSPIAPPAVEVEATEGLDDATLEAAAIAELNGEEPAAVEAPAAAKPTEAAAEKPAAASAASPPDEAADLADRVAKQVAAYQVAEQGKAERTALQQQVAKLTADLAALRTGLRERPLEVLEAEAQHDLESLTGIALGDKNPAVLRERQANARIAALEAKLAAADTAAEARAQAALNDSMVAQFKAENVRVPVLSKTAEFPHLLAEAEAFMPGKGEDVLVDVIYNHMNGLFQQSGGRGQVPPADVVARDLEAQAKKRFEVIRDRVTNPAAAKPAATAPKPKPKTLNNGLTQATPPDDDDISDAALERKARAVAEQMTADARTAK